jgi:hypothetical protein
MVVKTHPAWVVKGYLWRERGRYTSGMECSERDRLRLLHSEALLRWTEAGGLDPLKARDPEVIATSNKITLAAYAVLDHCKEHGCQQ